MSWDSAVQYNTSVFQVSPEDTLLPPSHGQLAPHSQVAPPIAFLWQSLRALNKFVTDTDTDISNMAFPGLKGRFFPWERNYSESEFDQDNGLTRNTELEGPLKDGKGPQIFTGGSRIFLPFPLP